MLLMMRWLRKRKIMIGNLGLVVVMLVGLALDRKSVV